MYYYRGFVVLWDITGSKTAWTMNEIINLWFSLKQPFELMPEDVSDWDIYIFSSHNDDIIVTFQQRKKMKTIWIL